ncbi:hypothetical protein AAVH_21218 [Aphelenchoides avenae]|nr:hypothetical protein AAVH_21218 [Aphelenchus avenae]
MATQFSVPTTSSTYPRSCSLNFWVLTVCKSTRRLFSVERSIGPSVVFSSKQHIAEFLDGSLALGILSEQETTSLMEWITIRKSPTLFNSRARHGTHVERIIEEFGLVRQFHCEHEAQASSTGSLREKCEAARTSRIHGDGDPRICLICHQVYCGISGCSRRDGIVDHYLRTDHALYFDGASILCQPCFAGMQQDLHYGPNDITDSVIP